MRWRAYSVLALISLVACICFAGVSLKDVRLRLGTTDIAWTMAGNIWIEWYSPRPLVVGPSVDPCLPRAFLAGPPAPEFNWINSQEPWRDDTIAGVNFGRTAEVKVSNGRYAADRVYHWIRLPSLLPVGVAICLPIAWVFSFNRRCRRVDDVRAGRCATCGYDLRASPVRCPECGAIQSGPAGRHAS